MTMALLSAAPAAGCLTAAVVLLAATGCSEDRAGSGGTASSEPPAAEYGEPPGPAGGPTLAPGDPSVDALVGAATSGPWTLAAAPDPDAAAVRIWAELGGCHQLSRAVAAETESTVTIAVLLREARGPGGECSASLTYVPLDVALDAPLGDRQLRHAAVDVAPVG